MPIEIKELHIRVSVSGKSPEPAKSARPANGKAEDHDGHDGGTEDIVAECVEQVLHILEARKER
ncbi:MAG: DUF5908 family protein [Rhizomicrobium sp.]|nr:DUF5908 family protein [Rhizomicrobium sp.]